MVIGPFPPRGVSCALLTPVSRSGELDLQALDRLVHRVVDAVPFPAGWKHAASVTGAIGNEMVPPGWPVDDVTAAAIELAMKDLGLAHT
jgi:dihydrodipicolinate synthase/N-acetylneuraminate lyase